MKFMRSIRNRIFVFLFAAVFCLSGISPVGLQKEIDRLNADTVLAHGDWGFCLMTADSGKLIALHNMQQSLIPASTLKTLTTGAALALLGPGFVYQTTLEYDGTVDKATRTLHGNLYIRGSGDPTLMSEFFKCESDTCVDEFTEMRIALSNFGIDIIDGDIIGDASCFPGNSIPDGWTWSDIGQYYGAGTSGLSYKDNSVSLFFDSSKGDSCILTRTDPVLENIVYRSDVMADGKKDEALVYGAPFGNIFYVHGSIPPGRKDFEVKAAHPEPDYQLVKDLANELAKNKLPVSGKATTVRRMALENKQPSIARKKIASISKASLGEIVRITNMKSDNMFAEQLLKTLGMLKGKGGTTEDGIEVVKNYWRSLGINIDGLYMTDGSGLSRSNGITTLIQASILQKASQQKWFPYFLASLPVAGRSGSMSSLCKGTLAENNLQAKTGYINRARGYAGYVKTKSGKLLCFSVLANNYTCSATEMKKRLERILVAMGNLE